MEDYSVALLGLGRRGEHYLQRFSRGAYGGYVGDRVERLSIAERLERRRQVVDEYEFECPVAVYASIEELSTAEDPNIVIDATNQFRRASYLKRFIADDTNVLTEKPLSRDLEDADELVELTDERDQVFAVGHNMNLYPGFTAAKETLDEYNGTVHTCTIEWKKWRGPRDHPVPEGIFEELPHTVGLAQELFGDSPSEATLTSLTEGYAVVDPAKYEVMPAEQQDRIYIVDDRYTLRGEIYHLYEIPVRIGVTLEWPDDTTVNIECDWEHPARRRRLLAMGTAEESGDNIFDKQFNIEVDFSPRDDEPLYTYTTGDVKEFDYRGLGSIERRHVPADFDTIDTLDIQLETFFNSVSNEEPHPGLVDLPAAYRIQETMSELVDQSGLR